MSLSDYIDSLGLTGDDQTDQQILAIHRTYHTGDHTGLIPSDVHDVHNVHELGYHDHTNGHHDEAVAYGDHNKYDGTISHDHHVESQDDSHVFHITMPETIHSEHRVDHIDVNPNINVHPPIEHTGHVEVDTPDWTIDQAHQQHMKVIPDTVTMHPTAYPQEPTVHPTIVVNPSTAPVQHENVNINVIPHEHAPIVEPHITVPQEHHHTTVVEPHIIVQPPPSESDTVRPYIDVQPEEVYPEHISMHPHVDVEHDTADTVLRPEWEIHPHQEPSPIEHEVVVVKDEHAYGQEDSPHYHVQQPPNEIILRPVISVNPPGVSPECGACDSLYAIVFGICSLILVYHLFRAWKTKHDNTWKLQRDIQMRYTVIILLLGFVAGGLPFYLQICDFTNLIYHVTFYALMTMGIYHYVTTTLPRESDDILGRKTLLFWSPLILTFVIQIGFGYYYAEYGWTKWVFIALWSVLIIGMLAYGRIKVKNHINESDIKDVETTYRFWNFSVSAILLLKVIVDAIAVKDGDNLFQCTLNSILYIVVVLPWSRFYQLQR